LGSALGREPGADRRTQVRVATAGARILEMETVVGQYEKLK
jgi:hypothetical protein